MLLLTKEQLPKDKTCYKSCPNCNTTKHSWEYGWLSEDNTTVYLLVECLKCDTVYYMDKQKVDKSELEMSEDPSFQADSEIQKSIDNNLI